MENNKNTKILVSKTITGKGASDRKTNYNKWSCKIKNPYTKKPVLPIKSNCANSIKYQYIRSSNETYIQHVSKTFNLPRIRQTYKLKSNKSIKLEKNCELIHQNKI